MNPNESLTEEQKEYLSGFAVGAGLSASGPASAVADRGPVVVIAPGPDRLLHEAQQRTKDAGGRLVNEEVAKGEKHPLDRWGEFLDRNNRAVYPSGIDVFHAKMFGMFFVGPAQNSYMCRMRFAGGSLTAYQLAGVADIADRCAGGYAHITTRANLQLREIPSDKPVEVLSALGDLGIVPRGAGADNIRNITASPTAGFDPQEWYDTLPLAKAMQQYITNHREMYHLPRKFNIAFDGGGRISTLVDTNDIGFQVVRVDDRAATDQVTAGTYFRLALAGITGHQQFASDIGWLISPDQCIEAAAAILRVFIQHGDRTDRRKARLKYLIDRWGIDRFLSEVRKELSFEPIDFPQEQCVLPPPPILGSHLGFQPAADGSWYVGLAIPVGAMTSVQMRDIARIANQYGSGQLRLTCWQNLLIPSIAAENIDRVKQELDLAGLCWQPHPVRAGLVACTGNAGCKFAASDTKRHALEIAEHVEKYVDLDQAVNIHLTGCHHSCAQHWIGDIGLIATKVDVPVTQIGLPQQNGSTAEDEGDSEEIEGYHVYVGGGFGDRQGLAKEIIRDLPAAQVPATVQQMLNGYLAHRTGTESFCDFTRRYGTSELVRLFDLEAVTSVS